MPDFTPATAPVTTQTLTAATSALCCRFGNPEMEARRRADVRALVRASRAFAGALERFVGNAMPRMRSEHCAADMEGDVRALTQALADWSYATHACADAYESCQAARGASPARA